VGAEDFIAYANGTRHQVCRATVRSARDAQRILLILLSQEGESSQPLASLTELAASEPPGAISAFVAHGLEDRSIVTVDPVHVAHSSQIAAAVAVMRASWAWDQSPAMRISVNGRRFAVVPRYSGTTWEATITPDAA
jgi:hypothetical protein